jgi:PTH1 family peptidyl-tRNA hydrolase
VDRFAEREGFAPARPRLRVLCAEKRLRGHDVILVKPMTYMNASGPAVRDLLEDLGHAGAPPADSVLLVHDDIDLPLGKIRFRARGSSGGHRGVDSVTTALGTDLVSRLKVGVGRPEGVDAAEHVLEPLEGKERARFLSVVEWGAGTLPVWMVEGVEAAANRFNGEVLED